MRVTVDATIHRVAEIVAGTVPGATLVRAENDPHTARRHPTKARQHPVGHHQQMRIMDDCARGSTPPLWSVKDSAPYLHDGRADTLVEAIILHGGQAAASIDKFRSLRSNDRANLIAFLETLIAPPQAAAK